MMKNNRRTYIVYVYEIYCEEFYFLYIYVIRLGVKYEFDFVPAVTCEVAYLVAVTRLGRN